LTESVAEGLRSTTAGSPFCGASAEPERGNQTTIDLSHSLDAEFRTITKTSNDWQLSPTDAMAVNDDEAFSQQSMLDTTQNALNHVDHFLVRIRSASQQNNAGAFIWHLCHESPQNQGQP